MDNNIYKTSNLALCPYLVMNNLEYVGYEIDPIDDKKIVFIFRDLQNRARDLEMLFTKSQEKQYHDVWAFFRSQLQRALQVIRGYNNDKKQ